MFASASICFAHDVLHPGNQSRAAQLTGQRFLVSFNALFRTQCQTSPVERIKSLALAEIQSVSSWAIGNDHGDMVVPQKRYLVGVCQPCIGKVHRTIC